MSWPMLELTRNGDGRIINIASTEGLGATAFTGPYTAAKHGVIGLTRSMAVELGRTGVTANCVCPGPIVTGMTEGIPEAQREKFARRRVPMRRYGIPEEVAHATLSLALPASSFLNGVIKEEDYIEQPQGLEVHVRDSHVCRLKKALYGLKQVLRAWYARIDGYFLVCASPIVRQIQICTLFLLRVIHSSWYCMWMIYF